MDQVREIGPRPGDTRKISTIPPSDRNRVIGFPSPQVPESRPGQRAQYISDAEIGRLVSVALEDALAALGQPDPETFLRLRAYDARAGIREMLSALRRPRAANAKMLRDYRKAMMLQNLGLELALTLVTSIRRYARVYEREIPAGIA